MTGSPTYQSISSPSLWYVRSATDPTHYYAVSTDARGLLRCECKSAQYRRTPCKHVRAVVAGQVRPATVKASPQPQPTFRLLSASTRMHGPAPFGPSLNAAPLPQEVADDIASLYSDGGAAIERSLVSHRAAVSA